MSDFSKYPWLGLAWLVLVGIVSSLAGANASGMAVWGPLVAAGAGWFALALLAGRDQARQAQKLEGIKNDERRLLDEFHALLEECSRQFSGQMNILRGELAQVQALLGEAIGNLTGSFTHMHENTRRQRDVTVAVTSGVDDGQSRQQFDDFVQDTSTVMQRVVDSIVNNSKLGVELIDLTDNIVARTRDVQSILSEIGAIAKQTNLLALNAAIEAARPARPGAALPWWPTKCATFPAAPAVQPADQHGDPEHAGHGAQTEEAIQRMASHDLTFAFESKKSVEQIVRTMEKQNQQRGAAIGQLAGIADEVDVQVGRAVTALQFQDIVSQLLGHVGATRRSHRRCSRHLASLAQTLQRNAANSECEGHPGPCAMKPAASPTGCGTWPDVTANNPVSQTEMNHGDVELF
jgi:methyl-accepting chemotaxis protein